MEVYNHSVLLFSILCLILGRTADGLCSETCTSEVLMTGATGPEGTHTCAQRILWMMKSRRESELSACSKVAIEFPKECPCAPEKALLLQERKKVKEVVTTITCNVKTCTRDVLDAMATDDEGTHTCEDRIRFLMGRGTKEARACMRVAREHPIDCGLCNGGPKTGVADVSSAGGNNGANAGAHAGAKVSSDLKRKGILTHWYNYVEVTTKPRPSKDFTVLSEDNSKPIAAREVVFVVLGSCKLPERTLNADKTWCGAQFPNVVCHIYIDCKTEDYPSEYKAKLKHVKLVSKPDYIFGVEHVPQPECCDRTVDFQDKDAYDGLGPSSYFCASGVSYGDGKHRSNTLKSQYRFLPALRHAKAQNIARFTSGAASSSSSSSGGASGDKALWLILVDDDSWVSIPRLLPVLGRYLPHESVQLGDFVQPYNVNATHWKRPFACGGAGTVLSAQAVMAVNLDQCISRFNNTCQQSDWMVGSCVASYGVLAVVGQSCMTCGKNMNILSNFEATQNVVVRGQCAFTQLTADILLPATTNMGNTSVYEGSRRRNQMHQWWTPYLMSTSAIMHTKRPIWQFAKMSCVEDGPDEDEAVAPKYTLPQTLIIGAQKAATTSLFQWLTSETNIYCPSPPKKGDPYYYDKEKHFWGRHGRCINDNMSLNAYRRYFPVKNGCKYIDASPLIGSPSTDPIFGQVGALQIFYSYPPEQRKSLRLVATLREPVDRLFSWYRHMLRDLPRGCKKSCSSHYSCQLLWRCLDKRDGSTGRRMVNKYGELVRCTKDIGAWPGAPDNVCHKEELGDMTVIPFSAFVHIKSQYLSTSTYAPYVRLWRQYFGDQLLLLSFDDLVNNPSETLERVSQHILGSGSPVNATHLRRTNVYSEKQESCNEITKILPCELRSELTTFFARHNDILLSQEPSLSAFQSAHDCC